MSGWVAGSVVLGAAISSSASKKAASTQAAAAEQSADVSKAISDQQIALQREQFNAQTALQREQFAAQKALEREQFDYQKSLQAPFQQAGVNALSRMQAGEFALPTGFNPNDPAYAQPGAFTFTNQDFRADPGYAFRLEEGQKALDRQAAARGGLISGAALKAATRYGQDMGSQEFQNAYQRALTGYGTKVQQADTAFNRALTGYNTDVARADTGYNRLASLAGVGQTATDKVGAAGQTMVAGIGSAGQNYTTGLTNASNNLTSGVNASLGNYGNAASNAYMGAANARASGYVGTANAINQGLGAYLNYTQSQNLLNRLSPQVPYNAYTTVPMQPGGGY